MSKKGKLLESYVQTIPYGKLLHNSNIKVNNRGEIVIIGKTKTWHVKDIDAAIRQQLFHVASQYEDMIVNWKKQMIHKGSVSEIEKSIVKINELLNTLQNIHQLDISKINDEILSSLQNIKFELEKKEKEELEKLNKVMQRGFALLEEKKRCELIIRNAIVVIIELFNALDNRDVSKIKWNKYFDALKKLNTVYVNPYRTKTQLVIYRKLRYDIYNLVKEQKLKEVKNLLWQGLEKLLPLYSDTIIINIGTKTMKINNGIISFIE